MIDYTELPKDGTAFEQFVREICLIANLHPQWTGKGPDGGRDLLLTEEANGPIAGFTRKWLVQCKHKAHSGKSVGRSELVGIVDDTAQAGATGYLLACSTQPSSGLATKLKEISADGSNRLATQVWDGIELERRLYEPRYFSLGHLFFPKSFSSTQWRLYNAGSPNHWTANYKTYFVHLSSRIAGSHPNLTECEHIISRLECVKSLGPDEAVRPRAIYFDDKHENFVVFVDYLVPSNKKPTLQPSDFNAVLNDGYGLHSDGQVEWYTTYWDVAVQTINPTSDHFDLDHYDFYDPHLGNFRYGSGRGSYVSELQEVYNSWR